MPANVVKRKAGYDAPGVRTFFLSIIITTILNLGFTWMLASTYNFRVSYTPIVLYSIAAALLITPIHYTKKIYFSFIPMVIVPLGFAFLLYFDIFDLWAGLKVVLNSLQENTFRALPGSFGVYSRGKHALTTLFALYNFIPTVFTTYFIVRRRDIITSLLFYLPYFICSVGLVFMFPDQIAFELAMAGLMLLVLIHVFRKKERKSSENKTLIMIVPVIAFMLLIGVIFPQDTYDKDRLAQKSITQLRSLVLKSPLKSNKHVMNAINKAEGIPAASELVDEIAQGFGSISGADTDLSAVGNFDPPLYTVCSVIKSENPDYNNPSIPTYKGSYLYLKASSKDVYEDNVWKSVDYIPNPFTGKDTSAPIDFVPCQYNIYLSYSVDHDVCLTPYYMDLYNYGPEYTATYGDFISGSAVVFAEDTDQVIVVEEEDGYSTSYSGALTPLSAKTSALNFYNSGYSFASSAVPEKCGLLYSDQYINDYVYGNNLEVPEETRQAIIDTGMLPDWYMQILNGEIEVSDADKVRAVTEFVRDLHWYDKNTDYPPDDVDFVAWFMAESDTGFCVHYATTTVILLRMIGVPARYVEGYMISGLPFGHERNVYSTDAHAWFEFYLPEFGWVMGDSTPGNDRAARNFDIEAIAQYYPEYQQVSYLATPDPNKNDYQNNDTTNTPTPVDQKQSQQNEPTTAETKEVVEETEKQKLDLTNVIGFGLIGIISVGSLLLIRLVYVLYWKSQFSTKEINDRTRSYYHYFKFTTKILNSRPPKRATFIAEKAAFSNEMIKDKELSDLIDISKRTTKAMYNKNPWYAKLAYKLFAVRF
ncbi:MAG: transglutaminase-like domain-containing protein [Clostridia bacterium]|nr:transglutaminase-like domain-containing protein [Clostridia bacterium]